MQAVLLLCVFWVVVVHVQVPDIILVYHEFYFIFFFFLNTEEPTLNQRLQTNNKQMKRFSLMKLNSRQAATWQQKLSENVEYFYFDGMKLMLELEKWKYKYI